MNRIGLILGVVVVLLSNGLALMQVAKNRAGDPVQTITLTERELPMQGREADDSSVSLRLAWRSRPSGESRGSIFGEPLFDTGKLRELGFDCTAPDSVSAGHWPLTSVVFAAFEYDPDSQDEKAQPEVADRRADPGAPPRRAGRPGGDSRLFFVDASRSLEQLQAKYPDQRKYLILRVVVRAFLEGGRDVKLGTEKPLIWAGYISQILVPGINVPVPFAEELRRLPPRSGSAPRYRVTLHFGRSLEPWVGAVDLQVPRP